MHFGPAPHFLAKMGAGPKCDCAPLGLAMPPQPALRADLRGLEALCGLLRGLPP